MSIAVSAIVYPSRILLAMTGAMTAVALCVSLAIAIGHAGDLPGSTRFVISALVFFLAFFGFYHGICNRKPIQLNISGTGQIRVLKAAEESPCTDTNWPHVEEIGEIVQLMNNSTIWPYMLLLRFRSLDGRNMIVPVLPDSVSSEGFRSLSVACRWLSVRNDVQGEKFF